jgi:uncharacterized protein YqeY
MLIDDVKKRMFEAMKAKDTVQKEILRTAIGEVTRTGDEPTDERVTQVLRKLVKANRETLEASTDAEQQADLKAEIGVLEGFLPQSLSAEQIVVRLADVAEAIRTAKGPGPAMGVAMKQLKSIGAEVEAREVQAAVAALRDS